MKQVQAFIGQEMFWENTAFFSTKYELAVGDEVLAKLDIDVFGSDAAAESAEGSITIENRGFFSTTYHISSGEMELAVFTPDWGNSGTLQFADGRTFLWNHTGFLSGEYAWKDSANNMLTSTP